MRHNLPERVLRDITALARKHGIGKQEKLDKVECDW